jgi:hypothetical protein
MPNDKPVAPDDYVKEKTEEAFQAVADEYHARISGDTTAQEEAKERFETIRDDFEEKGVEI